MIIFIIKNIINEKKEYNVQIDTTCYIKNSNKSCIVFNNKFNKLIIENSNDIYIEIYKIITSIEINNCNNVFIKINDIIGLPCIEIYKTSIYLIGDIEIYKSTLVISDLSDLYHLKVKE